MNADTLRSTTTIGSAEHVKFRITYLQRCVHVLFCATAVLQANVLHDADASESSQRQRPLNVVPQPIATDASIKYDYDIVYVRAPRRGDNQHILWAEVYAPLRAEPGADLVLLHSDGSEEVLVAAGDDAITDPFVSFDGQWVFYARYHNVKSPESQRLVSHSADIFKIHAKTKQVVQLTQQAFTPNTGVVAAKLAPPGVYNLGPCPTPGGKVMFTSNRNGFTPTKNYKGLAASDDYNTSTLQLFLMDDDGSNVQTVGHLNLNGALHPTILKDGRVMFTSFETQGLRDFRMWAIWTIHPDGTNWAPLVSNLGPSGETAYHFMTQLSDENIIFEEYYFQQDFGFGTYYKLPPRAPAGQPFFGPASIRDPRNLKYGNNHFERWPFSPLGLEWLTTFSLAINRAASHPAAKEDANSSRVGRVTHPSGAPDNHLLTAWSTGPVHRRSFPAVDSGIYLIKAGRAIDEPGQMALIKNDPHYNEQWPRALVPYEQIYGVKEPANLKKGTGENKSCPHLPEGSPFGLIGSSSLYKRESYPDGVVADGNVTSTTTDTEHPFQGLGPLSFRYYAGNWFVQGADAGKYSNSDIHAIRILITEPTTHPSYTGRSRRWWNIANERLRVMGEFPVRKFADGSQPSDPDGNPDTSFLAKIPADTAWTFQTLDKRGMVLNMAQTWHQLRPGEVRTNCGGCHAHSQKPTRFEDTMAARPNYSLFDLTQRIPLVTSKKHDESHKQWDVENETGLRYADRVLNVEFFRNVKPILERSCVACHTQRWQTPAGNLVLDDDRPTKAELGFGPMASPPADTVPNSYARLAMDPYSKFGHKSPIGAGALPNFWPPPQASRYVRYFQSRRSLLVWKLYGERLDGFSNDDFAYERVPGDQRSLTYQGKPFTKAMNNQHLINLIYTGSIMPPPDAIAGTYEGPDGARIKVPPLSDEDRLTLVRWIDLGCPIDFDYDPSQPNDRGRGWLADDNRATLAMTYPRAGKNNSLTKLLVGMYDYDSGLDLDSFTVTADFSVDDFPAGANLANKFQPKAPGIWQLTLDRPIHQLPRGKLVVSIRDKSGNESRLERSFSVDPDAR